MAQAKNGDKVKVHYTGKLNDGTIFDSSIERDTLEFTIGEHHVIPGFEEAVTGMNPGESKLVKILPEQAYGRQRPEMMATINRTDFPGGLEPEVGQKFKLQQPDGQPLIVTVTMVTDEEVTLDANHPLAGKDLNFDIKLVEIV